MTVRAGVVTDGLEVVGVVGVVGAVGVVGVVGDVDVPGGMVGEVVIGEVGVVGVVGSVDCGCVGAVAAAPVVSVKFRKLAVTVWDVTSR